MEFHSGGHYYVWLSTFTEFLFSALSLWLHKHGHQLTILVSTENYRKQLLRWFEQSLPHDIPGLVQFPPSESLASNQQRIWQYWRMLLLWSDDIWLVIRLPFIDQRDPCCTELSVVSAQQPAKHWDPQPNRPWGTECAAIHVSEHKSRSFPTRVFRSNSSPGWYLDCSLVIISEAETSAKQCSDSWPRKPWNNKCVLFP